MKCPACDEEISLLAGLKALSPYFIKCGSCRSVARVNMRGLHLVIGTGLLLTAGGLLASYITLRDHDEVTGAIVVCGAFLGFLLLEVLAFCLFNRYARLTLSRLGPDLKLDPAPPLAATPPPPPESSPDAPADRSPTTPD